MYKIFHKQGMLSCLGHVFCRRTYIADPASTLADALAVSYDGREMMANNGGREVAAATIAASRVEHIVGRIC
jgi:hypothetical protein